MAADRPPGKLAVILHADVAGSTRLVQIDEQLAHRRMQESFGRLSQVVKGYQGRVLELRGDALLAVFERASDAVSAALAFQQSASSQAVPDEGIRPELRIGIAMGEVVVADGTMTGEGVVLAQRLEQLAEPGGVVIQGAARETVPGRFPFEFDSLGEHELKGFEQAVRAFSAELRGDAELSPPQPGRKSPPHKPLLAIAAIVLVGLLAFFWLSPIREEAPPTAEVSRGTSIIVLPFDNLSDDTEQAYLAQGMTEDVTTDLSRISDLFVVSRNRASTYAGKAVDPQQVSRELGVSHLLEGSVRRVGGQLRINVQLIDGTTGGHVWANRFDGSADDILVFQDEVIQSIVSALSLELDVERENLAAASETKNPKAYDAFLRGWSHFRLQTPDDYVEAVRYFERAIELDPDYGRAYAALASTYWEGWERWWNRQLGFEEWIGPRHEAERLLEIAMQNPTPLAYQVAAETYRQQDRIKDMVTAARTSVRLDPIDPNGYSVLAWALMFDGQHEAALAAVDEALELDPTRPAFYFYQKGTIYFMLKEYEPAIEHLDRALAINPANFPVRNVLIALYGHLGDREAVAEQLELHPYPVSIDWMVYSWRFPEGADREHFIEGFRKAGIPELAAEGFPRPPPD